MSPQWTLRFIFVILCIEVCLAAWGVDVHFTSKCKETLELELFSPTGGRQSKSVKPEATETWVVCDDLCTGFLGAGKEHSWTWDATVADSSCSFSDSGSGAVTISGLDPGGKDEYVNLYCDDMACSDPEDGPGVIGPEDVPVKEESSSNPSSPTMINGRCTSVTDSGGPSKSSGMAGVLATLSNYIYEDPDEFKSKARNLLGDDVSVNFVNGPYDTEVGLVESDQSLYVVFRGSESGEDWSQNLKGGLVPTTLGGYSVNVHSGFLENFRGVEDEVRNFLDGTGDKKVYFAGHSLGAALAQLAALNFDGSSNTYTYAPPPIGDDSWVNAMSSSGVRDRTICFINPDDAVPFVAETLDSNMFAGAISWLADLFSGDSDISDVDKLRHGCRSVMITPTSCEESSPVYNESGDLEHLVEAEAAHRMTEYGRLVVGQCVSSSSGYPSCLDAGSADESYYESYDDAYYPEYDDESEDEYGDSGDGGDGDTSGGRNDSEDGQSLEKFNLEMDWNPSSCFGDDQCDSSKITNAFTVSEMTARLIDRSKDNSRCWDESSDQAKKLVVSDEVSKGTKAALECMFENAAGSNEDLWRDVYVRVGSCSGMSPSQYFDTVTRLFMSVGANQIAADFGLLSHDGTDGETEISVDRDSFLDYVTERVGRKAWVECDPDTRILRNVLVCVNPNDPYLIQDCTMDRNDPTSTNGIPCRGELLLPINPSGEISDKCSPYLLSEPNPALDGANTRITDPSPPGSSSQRWGRAGLLLATAFVLHI